MQRVELAVILTVVVAAAATAQSTRTNETQGPRTTHGLGYYDPTLQRVVLIGGAEQARAGDRDQVWSWTGTHWEPVTDSGPPARGNAGAAYDARRRMAIVTGGARQLANNSTFEVIADTWEGEQSDWQRITGTDLEPRDHQSMVYDEDRETVLMFGGILGSRSAPWPSGMVFDEAAGVVLLYSGAAAPGNTPLSDMWQWDGQRWTEILLSGPTPGYRYQPVMVYDRARGKTVLYGGILGSRDDTWEWDGREWREIRP
jgi:hypothetical protein